MKQFLIIFAALLISVAGKSQTATNNTACDVIVTPLCYNPDGPNCLAPVATPFATPVPATGMPVTISDCSPSPRVAVAYQVCWTACSTSCVIVDAASATFPSCQSSWSLWANIFSDTLPACGTCPSAIVSITGGNIQIN